jgi:hypothetical protein
MPEDDAHRRTERSEAIGDEKPAVFTGEAVKMADLTN